MTVVWNALGSDASGVVLFIVWLVLPPLYVITLGRRYARQCQETAATALWAREELRAALEDHPPAEKDHGGTA